MILHMPTHTSIRGIKPKATAPMPSPSSSSPSSSSASCQHQHAKITLATAAAVAVAVMVVYKGYNDNRTRLNLLHLILIIRNVRTFLLDATNLSDNHNFIRIFGFFTINQNLLQRILSLTHLVGSCVRDRNSNGSGVRMR